MRDLIPYLKEIDLSDDSYTGQDRVVGISPEELFQKIEHIRGDIDICFGKAKIIPDQDSYTFYLIESVFQGKALVIAFSNYFPLVQVCLESKEHLTGDLLADINAILMREGFVTVPNEILAEKYTGAHDDRFPTWLSRFFDYH
jgi:hypothetical protein